MNTKTADVAMCYAVGYMDTGGQPQVYAVFDTKARAKQWLKNRVDPPMLCPDCGGEMMETRQDGMGITSQEHCFGCEYTWNWRGNDRMGIVKYPFNP